MENLKKFILVFVFMICKSIVAHAHAPIEKLFDDYNYVLLLETKSIIEKSDFFSRRKAKLKCSVIHSFKGVTESEIEILFPRKRNASLIHYEKPRVGLYFLAFTNKEEDIYNIKYEIHMRPILKEEINEIIPLLKKVFTWSKITPKDKEDIIYELLTGPSSLVHFAFGSISKDYRISDHLQYIHKNRRMHSPLIAISSCSSCIKDDRRRAIGFLGVEAVYYPKIMSHLASLLEDQQVMSYAAKNIYTVIKNRNILGSEKTTLRHNDVANVKKWWKEYGSKQKRFIQ